MYNQIYMRLFNGQMCRDIDLSDIDKQKFLTKLLERLVSESDI